MRQRRSDHVPVSRDKHSMRVRPWLLSSHQRGGDPRGPARFGRLGTAVSGAAALIRGHADGEFHHRVPFAEGGASTAENVAFACALHNKTEAARWFDFDQSELESGPLGHTRDRARGMARG